MESRSLFTAKNAKESRTLTHEPPDIYLDEHIMDVKFSPAANVLALGQITGEVRLYTYSEKSTKEALKFDYHGESCRQVVFSPDGNLLYTSSADGSIGVISNGKLEGRLAGAHACPVNSLLHVENNAVIASGDDDGTVKLWDLRQAAGPAMGCVMTIDEHEDTVMDMALNPEGNMLLTASNDGHMGVFDLRKGGQLYAMSDNFEEDLTAIVVCKYGRKVLVSTSEGTVNVFSWDWFGDCNDRIVGHPNSIDTMIKFDEDTVITGSEDGLIRAVSVLPNKIIALLGDPTDQDEVFHIQKVALSHDKCLLASISLDDIVKIVDVSHLGARVKEDFDEEGYERHLQEQGPRRNRDARMHDEEEEKGSWESDYSSDESSSSEEEAREKARKKDRKLNVKGNNVSKSKKMLDDAKRQKFFSDL